MRPTVYLFTGVIHWTELLYLPLSPQIGAHFNSPIALVLRD